MTITRDSNILKVKMLYAYMFIMGLIVQKKSVNTYSLDVMLAFVHASVLGGFSLYILGAAAGVGEPSSQVNIVSQFHIFPIALGNIAPEQP